jgi:hypothetical protein
MEPGILGILLEAGLQPGSVGITLDVRFAGAGLGSGAVEAFLVPESSGAALEHRTGGLAQDALRP